MINKKEKNLDDHCDQEKNLDDHCDQEKNLDDHCDQEKNLDDHCDQEKNLDDHCDQEKNLDDHCDQEKNLDDHCDQEKNLDDHCDQEKNLDDHCDQEKNLDDHCYQEKKNLIKILEIQLQESYKEILEQEIISTKEIKLVHNRSNKEIEYAKKFSLEKLIIEFLPIIDNIERAVDLIKTNQSKNIFGEILTKLKDVSNLLEEFFIVFNIKKINDINVSFNPSIHQAMSIHHTNIMESNQIVKVIQAGYILHESRLLRPAMVMVSKKDI